MACILKKLTIPKERFYLENKCCNPEDSKVNVKEKYNINKSCKTD